MTFIAVEEQCGGLYIHEEMNQADSDRPVVSIIPEVEEGSNEALKETASGLKSNQGAGQKASGPEKQTPPVDLSKISPVSALRQQAKALGISWSAVLAAAFKEGIDKKKYTVATLESKGDELPPLFCQHLEQYLKGWRNQQPEK